MHTHTHTHILTETHVSNKHKTFFFLHRCVPSRLASLSLSPPPSPPLHLPLASSGAHTVRAVRHSPARGGGRRSPAGDTAPTPPQPPRSPSPSLSLSPPLSLCRALLVLLRGQPCCLTAPSVPLPSGGVCGGVRRAGTMEKLALSGLVALVSSRLTAVPGRRPGHCRRTACNTSRRPLSLPSLFAAEPTAREKRSIVSSLLSLSFAFLFFFSIPPTPFCLPSACLAPSFSLSAPLYPLALPCLPSLSLSVSRLCRCRLHCCFHAVLLPFASRLLLLQFSSLASARSACKAYTHTSLRGCAQPHEGAQFRHRQWRPRKVQVRSSSDTQTTTDTQHTHNTHMEMKRRRRLAIAFSLSYVQSACTETSEEKGTTRHCSSALTFPLPPHRSGQQACGGGRGQEAWPRGAAGDLRPFAVVARAHAHPPATPHTTDPPPHPLSSPSRRRRRCAPPAQWLQRESARPTLLRP